MICNNCHVELKEGPQEYSTIALICPKCGMMRYVVMPSPQNHQSVGGRHR